MNYISAHLYITVYMNYNARDITFNRLNDPGEHPSTPGEHPSTPGKTAVTDTEHAN